jgi:chromosome segregation ATPase
MVAELPRAVELNEGQAAEAYTRLVNEAVEADGELQTPVDDVLRILRDAGIEPEKFQVRVEAGIHRRAERPKLEAVARQYVPTQKAWREAKAALTVFAREHNIIHFDQGRFNAKHVELTRAVSRSQSEWTAAAGALETLQREYPESCFAEAYGLQNTLRRSRSTVEALRTRLTRLERNLRSAQGHIAELQKEFPQSAITIAPDVKASEELHADIEKCRGALSAAESESTTAAKQLDALIRKHKLNGIYSAD